MSKHLKRILSLLLALVMVVGLLPTVAFSAEDKASLDIWAQIEALRDGVQKKAESADYSDYVSISDDVYDLVEASGAAVPGSLQMNGAFVKWRDADTGIPCCYSPSHEAEKSTRAYTVDKDGSIAEYENNEAILRSLEKRGGTPAAKNIGLIQPFYRNSTYFYDSSFLNYSPLYLSQAQALATYTGGQLIRYTLEDATLDTIADTMESCGMVIFDSHGGTDYENPNNANDCVSRANCSYLWLSSACSSGTEFNQHWNEYLTFDEYCGSHDGEFGSYDDVYLSTDGNYCVSGRLIANRMDRNAPNSLLHMSVCLGMATDGMEAPLRAKGVEAIYGYSQSVTFSGEVQYMKSITNSLMSDKTLAQAVASAKSSWGDWDGAQYSYFNTIQKAHDNFRAFPIVVSSEDAYPGHGNVDALQTVNSTWKLKGAVVEEPCTITLNAGTTTWGTVSTTTNATATLPAYTGTVPAGYTFAGWTASQISDTTQIKPALYNGTYATGSATDVTLYACFSKTEAGQGGTSDYVKVTSTSELTNGKYLIVYEAGRVALNSSLATIDTEKNTISVTITNHTIPSNGTTNAAAFTFTASNGAFLGTNGKYIGHTGTKNTLSSGTSPMLNTVSIDSNGNAVINAGGSFVLRYNNTSDQCRFRFFKGTQQPIQLYKKGTASSTTTYTTTITVCNHTYAESDRLDATCTEAGTIKYTCSKCGDTYYDDVPALGHDYINHAAKAPTCTAKGWDAYQTCSRCDYTTYVEKPALGHDYINHAAKAPTCTAKGWDAYQTCSHCDYTTYVEKPALGHDYINHAAKAPTCTEKGWDAYQTCSHCDYTTYVEKPALGHDYINHAAKAPTCTAKGWDAYQTCSRCSYTTYVEKPALGHDYINHAAKAPTCTAKGWDAYQTCSHCDYTTYVEKPALGHDYINHAAKAPTCTEKGWDAYQTCSRCAYSTYVEKPALGHDYKNHAAKAPTCTEIGWNAYQTCNRCDYTTYKEILALGHDLIVDASATATCTEPGMTEGCHCSRCDYQEKQRVVPALGHDYVDHAAKAPTCTEIGWNAYQTCNRCAYSTYVEKSALGHDYKNHAAKAPTCTEIGWNAYQTCSRCDYSTYVEKPALGHDYKNHAAKAPTCTKVGWDAYLTCSRCDYTTYKEIPALGHNLIVDASATATCTEPGMTEGCHCSRCDYQEKQRVVPALGHDYADHVAKAATCTEIGWNAYQTCSRCDYSTYVEKPALGHDYKNHAAKAPTCTEIGWNAYQTCSRCAYSTYVEKTALGHDYVNHAAKAPTCTEIGWNAYLTCSRCDYTTYKEIPALGHDYADHVAKAPTCTEIGWNAYQTCSRCAYSTYVEKTALGHDYVNHAAKAPTCTEIGWNAYQTCSRCAYSTCVEKTALGHDYVNHAAKAPTCTEIGWNAYQTCSRCDYSTYVEKPALGHDYKNHAAKAPTCTEIGWNAYQSCTRCECSTYKEIDALGHSFEYASATAPTTTIEGKLVGTCTRCDAMDNVSLPALNKTDYSYVTVTTATCTDSGTAKYTWNNTDYGVYEFTVSTLALGHSYETSVMQPTCTVAGYTLYSCIRCEDTYQDNYVSALGHDIIDDEAVSATCTEPGLTAGKHCSRCDTMSVAQEIIPALGHDYVNHSAQEPTCVAIGWDAYQTCSRCDYSSYNAKPALGHDIVIDELVPATCTEPGLTKGEHCTRCDFCVAQEVIPALEHDYADGVCSRCGADDPNYKPIDPDKPCDGGDSCPGKNFTDMPKPNNWAHAGIDFCVENGLFVGTSATTFSPNGNMTRAMLVTVLYRLDGQPAVTASNPFSDVANGQWFTNAIIWAADKGVVSGVGNGKFNPNGNITREQIATIMYRYAEYKSYDVSATADLKPFPDETDVSTWAYKALAWANAEGLVSGVGANGTSYLQPLGNATRAQVDAILMRYVKNIAEAK